MALRPSRLISTTLAPSERSRILWLPPFKSSPDGPNDKHLIQLGLIRNAGAERVTLTPAGRVVRRLLQELEQCCTT